MSMAIPFAVEELEEHMSVSMEMFDCIIEQ